MRNHTAVLLWLGIAVTLFQACFAFSPKPDQSINSEDVGLAPYMGELQRFSHKFALAIDRKNQPLANFYLEEIRETLDQIVNKVPEYEGFPVASTIKTIMFPLLPELKKSLDGADWHAARQKYGKLVDGCNRCHAALEHEFIRITVAGTNPFNQDFTSAEVLFNSK